MLEPPEWQTWMRAAQQGDRGSYAAVLRAAMPVLGRAARARWPAAAASDIEDAVQETLIAFHTARHLYDPTRPVLPFLLGIMRFRGADALARRRRHMAVETVLDFADQTLAASATDSTQDAAMDRSTLRAEIGRLPMRQRQALELTKLQGLSLEEASTATGMSVTALKVATHRAIRSLRKRLGFES